MSLKRDLSGSYWSLLWVAFDFFFCFLILFVHSKPLDMNSFPPRNTKLGQILLWNSSADSWDSENNTNRMSLQPFSKHLWRTSCLCACACMRVSLVQRWAHFSVTLMMFYQDHLLPWVAGGRDGLSLFFRKGIMLRANRNREMSQEQSPG